MTRKETQRLKRERIIEENGIIFLDNVSKSYSSGSPALNGVSLSIGRGEFGFTGSAVTYNKYKFPSSDA